MAGAKGRSGGARAGAGRKRRPAVPNEFECPREFLLAVMDGRLVPSVNQMNAAKALLRAIPKEKPSDEKR